MFKTNEGGTKVKGGFYWHQSEWELTTVDGAEGTLPGGADAKYVKVPVPVMLVGAPLMGALLVMFLPLIGIALLVGHAGRNVYGYVRTVASSDINLPVEAHVEPAAGPRLRNRLHVTKSAGSHRSSRKA